MMLNVYVIMELQVKTRYHYIPIRVAKIQNHIIC